ncbi:hypothetical protein [Companilactobacillus kimchiensis]|uniref:Uncharacterized protein n=1 Tax=Companilactobacillus kimchiensis TaxID=993692 RepID=A0A0R2LDE8_9LACO|nr:hypothetical protein [Companilactobacillus kimchiensis]KRN99950.1 hypothetical protein IV57_GL002283 [Companilactobacillus kimchiensis]
MKEIIRLVGVAIIAAIIVVLVSLIPMNAIMKSIIYAIVLGLFIYVVALIMRLNQ